MFKKGDQLLIDGDDIYVVLDVNERGYLIQDRDDLIREQFLSHDTTRDVSLWTSEDEKREQDNIKTCM